jgi:hypothetical protein
MQTQQPVETGTLPCDYLGDVVLPGGWHWQWGRLEVYVEPTLGAPNLGAILCCFHFGVVVARWTAGIQWHWRGELL